MRLSSWRVESGRAVGCNVWRCGWHVCQTLDVFVSGGESLGFKTRGSEAHILHEDSRESCWPLCTLQKTRKTLFEKAVLVYCLIRYCDLMLVITRHAIKDPRQSSNTFRST